MKKFFILYRPFLLFLGKFLLSYLLFTIVYESYLDKYDIEKFEVDGITRSVAKQTKDILLYFDYDAGIIPDSIEPGIKFFYKNIFIARIIEGCNGIGIIILFSSFIIAFSGRIKTTVLYILGGSLLLHILNMLRIAILCVLLYYFPNREPILHGVFFPLFIYSSVFILWIIWIRKFSLYAKTSDTKS
ncbi:exosortase family protein XrtF [Flavobacterium sp.]|uniref:exosortase family protein XrtF n=1 Tax=Flavobacterium sp. TaxID=239 RepID=UPI0038FBF3C6